MITDRNESPIAVKIAMENRSSMAKGMVEI
ncbi:hypothetical protein PE36_18630 [Moritella sp. PE36]|nr:hypothetical protein PE36_18630 [Moritella sp. PE36]